MAQRSTASASSKSSKRKVKTVKENSTVPASDVVSSPDAEAGSSVSKWPNTAAEKQQVRLMVRECNSTTENAAIRKEGKVRVEGKRCFYCGDVTDPTAGKLVKPGGCCHLIRPVLRSAEDAPRPSA